jgi:S1-C subfamily serine protease
MFVPIDRLKPALADLLAFGRPGTPARPWLGINAHEADGKIVVIRISPDGPAQKAGLNRGDVIVGIGGQPVNDLAAFYRKLWSLGPAGADVNLTVTHGGETRDVTVKTIDRYKFLKLNTTY